MNGGTPSVDPKPEPEDRRAGHGYLVVVYANKNQVGTQWRFAGAERWRRMQSPQKPPSEKIYISARTYQLEFKADPGNTDPVIEDNGNVTVFKNQYTIVQVRYTP